MQDLFQKGAAQDFRDFIRRPGTLLAWDFDGTLAPIVTDPRDAFPRATTVQLFNEIAAIAPMIAISGRARADLAVRTANLTLLYRIGNHGAEWGEANGEEKARESLVQSWIPDLDPLRKLPGVEIENKRLSISVHFRECPRSELHEILHLIRETISRLSNCRILGGKEVVNLTVEGAPNKGDALIRAMALLEAKNALYVGDDCTDEDIFALDQRKWGVSLLTIRVGNSPKSHARFYIEEQRQIDSLLHEILTGIRNRNL